MHEVIFLVRGHCRNRPMIFLRFSVACCCFFSDVMGWCVTMVWGFSDCDPPSPPNTPFNIKNPTQPNHPPYPQPPSSSRRSRARKLRFAFVAIHLGSLVGNRLHLGRGVLYLRLAFGVIVLHSLAASGANTGARQNQKETKKKEEEEEERSIC